MRVWIDLANSPHVPLFRPVVDRLEARGDSVLLTARDHAQTVELARAHWPDIRVVGGLSPAGRVGKARTLLARVLELRRIARDERVDVALSHNSYAQIVAARAAGIRPVTMMDYEHQPANHLAFRMASRVLVPDTFPESALRRYGARASKVRRYDGFKEQLYLADFEADPSSVAALGVDEGVVVAMRPPPEGALYHRHANERFDEILDRALAAGARVVLLPRTADQRDRYSGRAGVVVPAAVLDGRSLLATVDAFVGGGGTMTREAALLGTPTYTVFAGELAAVDAELIRRGLVTDLRDPSVEPRFEQAGGRHRAATPAARDALADAILDALGA